MEMSHIIEGLVFLLLSLCMLRFRPSEHYTFFAQDATTELIVMMS